MDIKEFNLSISEGIEQTSSMGNLLKWINDNRYIKTSTYNNFNNLWLYESYSELICCRLFKELGVSNVLMYYPCKINLDPGISTFACYSQNFLKDEEKLLSIASILKSRHIVDKYSFNGYQGYTSLLHDIKAITGIDYEAELNTILELDYITLNQDRHLGNLGFIFNLKTKQFRIAPVFDNGSSLFSMYDVSQFSYDRTLDRYVKAKPFNFKHSIQVQYIGDRVFQGKSIDKTLSYIDKLQYV